MTQQRNFWMRWRVRTGYPVAIIFMLLAAPTPRSILIGAAVALLGILIRGTSSGYLRKYEELATTGPYARTRNPLYFGSSLLAVGFAIAGNSWIAGLLVVAYFAIFYTAVMRNEESDLRTRFGTVFNDYAARVPLFFPRLAVPRTEASASLLPGAKTFSWAQYRRNREYQALLGTIAGLGVMCFRMWIHSRLGY
jgi:protein-S-isoprenylcysteine O-methyltransferase Ste14